MIVWDGWDSLDLRHKVPQSHRAEKVLRHGTTCKLIYMSGVLSRCQHMDMETRLQ
jgi:hypothetical protein